MNHEQHFEMESTARLQCLVTEPAKADLFWTKDNLPVMETERIQFEEYNTVLVIQNFTTKDNGRFECNIPRSTSFDTFTFDVSATLRAKIIQFTAPETVLESRDAALKCDFTGIPLPKLRFYKATTSLNKELISTSEKYQVDGNLLIIRNVTDADTGEYTCSIENFASSDNVTIRLNVDSELSLFFLRNLNFLAKPRIRKTSQLFASLDDTKNVTCFASGKNVTLLWYTNEFNLIPCGHLINEQKYSCVENGTKSTLIYRNVSAEDSRKFTCVAQNAAGKDVWEFNVDLTSKCKQQYNHICYV